MNKEDFPIFLNPVHNRPLVYLDNAATTQKPQAVLDAIQYAYTHFNANIHRGVHHLSQVATEHHEQSRTRITQFLNAKSSNEIIFTKGTTDSINLLARSFGDSGLIKSGDEIIISYHEHHSNIVPWQMLCQRTGARLRVIPMREDLTLDISKFESLLSRKTKLVSVTHVSNVLGLINPVKQIITLAHQQNIPVLIDAAQSAPHIPLDVQDLDCDFLAFSAHKLYGPTGVGVLYGKERWLDQLPPVEGGGEMIEHVSFSHTTFNSLPFKFEAGTPNFIGSYATAAAIDYISSIGLDTIAQHEQQLVNSAIAQLQSIPNLTIYGDTTQPRAGVISFNLYDSDGAMMHPFDVGTLLDQQAVAVRTGHHCAQPLIEALNVTTTIRISFGLYNCEDDILRFVKALRTARELLS